MSPASQQIRKKYAQYQRSSSIRKLRKLEGNDVVLSDSQNEEMCAIMKAARAEDLDKLYQEGDQHGVGSLMKTLWLTDKNRQKSQFFFQTRKRIVSVHSFIPYYFCLFLASGNRGNRWNMITIHIGK